MATGNEDLLEEEEDVDPGELLGANSDEGVNNDDDALISLLTKKTTGAPAQPASQPTAQPVTPTQPAQPVTPQGAPAMAQAPVTAAQPTSPSDDKLSQYLLQRQEQAKSAQGQLMGAQAAAGQNQGIAQLGQAFANIGSSIAHAPGQAQANQGVWNNLQASAHQPVTDVEQRLKYQGDQNKLLNDYLMQNAKFGQKKELQKNSITAQNERSANTLEEQKRHNDILGSYFTGKVGLQKQGLDLRTGSQAAAASKPFLNDKVMMTASTQEAQIQKGLGRISDIESGKLPFTKQVKADIEKDIANVISGGTSSSLGVQERVEFEPFIAKWNEALSNLKGVPQDLEMPKYTAMLKTLLSGLKSDIAHIRAHRAENIGKTTGTAYSLNPLATKAIKENVQNNQVAPEPAPAQTQPQEPPPPGRMWKQNAQGQWGSVPVK